MGNQTLELKRMLFAYVNLQTERVWHDLPVFAVPDFNIHSKKLFRSGTYAIGLMCTNAVRRLNTAW